MRQPFVYDASFAEALSDLHASWSTCASRATRPGAACCARCGHWPPTWHPGPPAQRREQPRRLADASDSSLLDRSPRNLKDVWTRLRTQLTPTSLLFRHALRLPLACHRLRHGAPDSPDPGLLDHPHHAVRLPAQLRRDPAQARPADLGTAIGLTVAWALFDLFPNPLMQSCFAVVAGVVFFVNRTTRYTLATAAITLMVLFCFNQIGDGYGLFLPRLFDTLLGSLIAGLAVFLFLPDWQGRRLNKVLANTLACNSIYLRQIMQQYAAGKRDDLAYRLARRNAHNADAALSTTLANMLMEPGHFRKEADVGFRFLVLSHTLLSYLSGLGAHRETQLPAEVREHLIEGAGVKLAASIDEIAQGLASKRRWRFRAMRKKRWPMSWSRCRMKSMKASGWCRRNWH
jgi:uncharacterized membrane protein YccC